MTRTMFPVGLLAEARPSDDAFVEMFRSAKRIIHMSLQDVGPITVPAAATGGAVVAVPGCGWPKHYLKEFGRALNRGVEIEIALSTPGSCPGGLGPTEALYGNGWTCADVASEIIKTLVKYDPDITEESLRENAGRLRLCYLKNAGSNEWADGKTMGNHAKHFIIDDRAYYVGSQNLYVCDLAEWGVLTDDEKQTKKMMSEYWTPMWKASFTPEDCDLDEVLDPESLSIDRNGEKPSFANAKTMRDGHKNNGFKPGGEDNDFHDDADHELHGHHNYLEFVIGN